VRTVYVRPEAADAIVDGLGFHYRDRGLMVSALGAPLPVFGIEVHPGIHEKAAALIVAINRNHPIIEGNKRTGWLLTTFFYAENGYDLVADVDDAAAFCVSVALRLDIAEAAAWLKAHARKVEP
jgi:death-on-curing protein